METCEASEQISFVAAVHKKYSDYGNDNAVFCKIYIPNSMPGKRESGDLVIGPQLILHDCAIVCAGEPDEISSICCNVTELDLTDNKITEWSEVFKIVENCPRLEFLNVTGNRLIWDIEEGNTHSFPGISQLILNKTAICFEDVVKLLNICPSVQTLHLSLNGYTQVTVPSQLQYPNLKRLHFNGNKVTEWNKVSKLGYFFPNLTDFVMIESDIRLFCPDASTSDCFQHLQSLNVSKSVLSDWVQFEKLREFPCLVDVRIQGIPFLESFPEKRRRQLLIAYIPNITRLNGSTVHATEREDAERAFIRYYMESENKPSRYFELEQKHGKVEKLAKVSLKPQEMYKVKVTFENKSEYMDISIKQNVGELKKFLQDFVGHPPSEFRVFMPRPPLGHEHLNVMTRDLTRCFSKYDDNIELFIDLAPVFKKRNSKK